MTNTAFPSDPTDYRLLLRFMLHELRRIQDVLQGHATQLSIAIKGERVDESRVRAHVPFLTEELYVMHSWLSIADLHVDPEQFAREPKQSISLYRAFDRARIQLSRRAKAKQITINLDGEGDHSVMAHRIVTVLPFLVLDNALKYSPKAGRIDVTLATGVERETVTVESVGPVVTEVEMAKVFNVGFRGKGAEAITSDGNGQGLALLKSICTYHNADVVVSSTPGGYSSSGVPHGQFIIEMRFPRQET